MGYKVNLAAALILAAGVAAGLYRPEPNRPSLCDIPDGADLPSLAQRYTALARSTNYQSQSLGLPRIGDVVQADPHSLRISANRILYRNFNILDHVNESPAETRAVAWRLREIERTFHCK